MPLAACSQAAFFYLEQVSSWHANCTLMPAENISSANFFSGNK
jgi:hypothetical protein